MKAKLHIKFIPIVIALTLLTLFVGTMERAAARVIVQGDDAIRAVENVGGEVAKQLDIINAVSADLTPSQQKALAARGFQLYENRQTQASGNVEAFFPEVAGVDEIWAAGITGKGVGVAIVDSGIDYPGSASQITKRYDALNKKPHKDVHGHGSFMASLIANSHRDSNGFMGIAPDVNLIDVRVLDHEGKGTTETVLDGLNWILNNHAVYNIRVVNISLISAVAEPYWENPLNQAVEQLWAAGVVVVAPAGNDGPGPMTIASPGNDPFIVTAGAFTDNFTPYDDGDDYITPFSGAGPTEMGFVKPDIVAPGAHVVGRMLPNTPWAKGHRHQHLGGNWYTGAGTSAASAITSGIVALMLDHNPSLTPDQVKYRLIASARTATYDSEELVWSFLQQGAGRVSASEAVFGNYNGAANVGMTPGEKYVGPVTYQDDVFVLVDENGQPIPELIDYAWDGNYLWTAGYKWGGHWDGNYLWTAGYKWGGSHTPGDISGGWQSGYSWDGSYSWAGGYQWEGAYSWAGGYQWGGAYSWAGSLAE